MSEYQYYEFQTVGRRLSEKEMQELRSWSTRALITPTSFSNEYSWGDFKGDPDIWMEKYFDGFVYVANWGTHEFQLALPSPLLSTETAQCYCDGEAASAREKYGKLILTFRSEDESGGDWVEGEGILSSLLPVRDELAQGDLRGLYIGWLLNVQAGYLEEEAMEPPVPPNLDELSNSLSNLVEFLRIEQDLLAVAAQASPRTHLKPAPRQEMGGWVAQLPAQEKDELLVRLLAGEDAVLGPQLRSRFRRGRAEAAPASDVPRRTVGELMAAAQAFTAQRQRDEARRAAEKKALQKQMEAIARQKHLDALAGRESELWVTVERLVATKVPKKYDLGVEHLLDLRDLAVLHGREADFSQRLASLRETHSRKPSFITRLRQKLP